MTPPSYSRQPHEYRDPGALLAAIPNDYIFPVIESPSGVRTTPIDIARRDVKHAEGAG